MIICERHTNSPTISKNVGDTNNFTIKSSSRSFAILSSSLYKNKIRAIIRELSCNSRDAMIAAGKEQSFYCHLPTKMEPEFYVRDEGIGLSHEDVMSLYTTYFESTKSTSNLFVGALGLGSKSPFSYTENFTVTSIKDGIRGIYSAYINDSGVPSIVQMFSENTDEANGVEVRMAVASADHATFLKEASSIYQWFDVKPHSNISLHVPDIAVNTFDHHTEVEGNDSIVVMGGVAYHFDMWDFIPDAPKIKFLMKFEIGTVDVLPSREGLQNTNKTKSAIVSEFNRIKSELTKLIIDELELFPSYYDRVIILKNHKTSLLENYIKHKIYNSDYSDYGIITCEDLSLLNLVGATYSDSFGKKTIKKFNKDIITVGHMATIFIYNDLNYPINLIKEYAVYSHRVFIFTPLNKKIPVGIELFQEDILYGAEVLIASEFVVKPEKSQKVNKNPLGVFIPEVKKYSIYHYGIKEYKLVIPCYTDIKLFKFFVRLDDKNHIVKNGIVISLASIVKLVGASNLILLKKTSKFDTTEIVDFFDHVDAELKKMNPIKLPNLNYDNTNFINSFRDNETKFDDQELNDIIALCKIHKIDGADYKIDEFMKLNSTIYSDKRVALDSMKIEHLSQKYSAVNKNCASKSMLKLLINTIHNNKEI